MNKFYKLHSDCSIFSGKSKCCIVDLRRADIHWLPLEFYGLIQAFEENSISELDILFEAQKSIYQKYLKFLLGHELIFECGEEDLERHTNINSLYYTPYDVTNLLLDFNKPDNLSVILPQVNELNISYVQVRVFSKLSSLELSELCKYFKQSSIKSYELLIPFNKDISNIEYFKIFKSNPRICKILVFGADQNHEIPELDFIRNHGMSRLIFSTENLNIKSCGKINNDYFFPSLDFVNESISHNTCLNRKISIDVNGDIKNCPSMLESYGNIKDTTLKDALAQPSFKKYWNIKKDDITKCKDCEFRHVCTDCRAYRDNPSDIYSAPLKCGYDPYSGEWKEWSTNPLKQKAIDFYEMREII